MTSVFQRLSIRDDVHALMLVVLVALALSGIAAHWLTRIPGPLTPEERRASRSSRVRRLLGWSAIVFAVLTWLAAMWMMASPQAPRSIVLVSRMRTKTIDEPSRIPLSTARGARCDKPTSALLDVGPTVDRIIDSIDARQPWERGGPEERFLAKQALFAAPDLAHEVPALDAASRRTLTGAPIPRWLVESFEISVVLRTAAERHVDRVYVAPGASLGPSSWRILGEILRARGVDLCLIDPPSETASDGFAISRLAYATLSRDNGTVTVWAVVDGATPIDERGRTLELRMKSQSFSRDIQVVVTHDEERSRIVQLCFGGCPAARSDDVFDLASRALGHEDVFFATQDGRTSTQIFEDRKSRSRPILHAVGPIDQVLYRTAFDKQDLFREEQRGLRVELEASGIPIPTTNAGAGEGRHAFLRESGNLIVVASSDAAARAASTTQAPGTSGKGRRARVVRDDLGPRTLYSYFSIAPPTLTTASVHLPLANALVEAGASAAPIFGPQTHPEAFAGVVRVDLAGDDKVVVIAPGAPTGTWRDNPFWALPTLRAIAYAADLVSRPKREDLTTTGDPGGIAQGGPLVTEAELSDAFRNTRHLWDLVCVAVIGTYLWLSWRRRRH